MAQDTAPKYVNQQIQDQSDNSSTPTTQRTSLYGWDPVGLQKVKVKTDSSGQVYIANPGGATDYTQVLDYVGGSNPIYVGFAVPGTATSAASWKIKKITYSGSNATNIQWAGGAAFNQIWDNRASLTYA